MPADDWQFWLVSAMALGALLVVAWPLLPRRRKDAACCGGGASKKRGGTKARLTVSASSMDRQSPSQSP
ncbi:MAG: hypothetical protein O2819_02585 [Planctomycetota bacterium]|nr:hypothetical protein [Planctomycetota bacterium]MDA1105793.1 hypothetical protein [Planctomycetota bacterium]